MSKNLLFVYRSLAIAAICLLFLVALGAPTSPAVHAQTPVSPPSQESCCGPITSAGQQLLHLLDSMDVDHLWLAGHRVDWQTGAARPEHGGTHCSAFAAEVGERLGIYLLRPPDHPQEFLASAQGEWFKTDAARHEGWSTVPSIQQVQTLANQGNLVVLVFISPDPAVHGHIAIVRPALISTQQLEANGPETIQAGLQNFADGNARFSFRNHPGAWPAKVDMYVHATRFSQPSQPATTQSTPAQQ